MGGWRQWDEVAQCLLGTSVYLETSFSLEALGSQRAVEMMRTHGLERVLFGTDWPWQEQKEGVAQVNQLGLSDDETRKLLWSNAAKLLNY
jgi:hypothetical protein